MAAAVEQSLSVALEPCASSLPSTSSRAGQGYRGVFKVPSLVFDIELEDGGIGVAWTGDSADEDETVTEIARFVAPSTPAEARLVSDVKVAIQHAKDGQDTGRIVAIMQALGYRCTLRTALGGGDGADCLRNLRHTFITCDTPAGPGSPSRRYIIDPLFKEQFIIAKTTARYASILAAIPQVFVGPEEHLVLLVNFLCTEMNAAFRQLGSVLPPWRHASSMLSKWKPRKSVDEPVFAGLGAARVSQTGAVGAGGVQPAVLGGGGGMHWPWQQQQQQAAVLPLQVHDLNTGFCMPGGQQQHHWQQATLIASSVSVSGGSGLMQQQQQRPSFEPQRVYFGGNFTPIAPAPAS